MKNQPKKGFFNFFSEKTQNFYLEWLFSPLPPLSPLLFFNDNNFGFSFACCLSFLYCRGKKNNLFCRLAQAMCQWITFFLEFSKFYIKWSLHDVYSPYICLLWRTSDWFLNSATGYLIRFFVCLFLVFFRWIIAGYKKIPRIREWYFKVYI